jgi:DNA-directed RNA polymerase II subunit RPB1
MSMFKELSAEQDITLVTGVQFGLIGPAEYRRRSVVEVTTHELYFSNQPVKGGVLDPRMGVLDHGKVCGTCGLSNIFCPGHFGHIELAAPMWNVCFLDAVRRLLRCVCFRCSSLLIPPTGEEGAAKLLKMSRKMRFEHAYKASTKSSVRRLCPVCTIGQPSSISKDGIYKLVLEFKPTAGGAAPEEAAVMAGGNGKLQMVLLPQDADKIMKRISDEECELLGFSASNRPEKMVYTVFPVLPPCARPTVHNDANQRREDDLTHKLCEIVKYNNMLRVVTKGDRPTGGQQMMTKEELTAMTLQHNIATFADNSMPGIGSSQHRNGRPTKSVLERLKGKEGRVRGNLLGKRVDFSARSVITPDPNISIDQVGVPVRVAMNLTFPETVNTFSRERLEAAVANGPFNYPGARFVRKADSGRTFAIKPDRPMELALGDVVERHMVNDDPVLFNRQPSLHRMSMMTHRVRVMPFDTFRLNPCVTPCYNADYDGDEMNLHVPQSIQTAVELQELAPVSSQFLSPRLSSPMITVVQDIALGIHRMTLDGVTIPRRQLFNLVAPLSNFFVPPATGDAWTGRQLLSCVIPRNTFLEREGKGGPVRVIDGDILAGVISKSIYSDAFDSSNLVQLIFREHGGRTAATFLDDTQRLVCDWFCGTGFSVGVSDLVVSAAAATSMKEVVSSCKAQIAEFFGSIHTGTFNNDTIGTNQEFFEATVQSILSNADNKVYDVLVKEMDPLTNRLNGMITAGSKGGKINIQQMAGMVGQQGVEVGTEQGKHRVPYSFDDRTLPHFTKYDDSAEARGFVQNSFLSGLTPHEFFFHAMAGREGLIDTAVKTSDTGYMQRKLMKAMEDTKIAMDTTVRSCNGSIIQYAYGGDGFDAARLEVQPFPTIPMKLHEVEAAYSLTEGDLDALALCVSPEALKRMTSTPGWQERFAEYYTQVLRDRADFATHVSGGKRLPQVYFPVCFPRIMTYVRCTLRPTGPLLSDVSPLEVLDLIEELSGMTAHINQPRVPMLGMLLRAYLNPRGLAMGMGLGSDVIDFLRKRVRAAFRDGLAHPSELVGVIAGQSIGEPSTQMTLNSFHSAGVASASRLVQGFPRLKELLHASRNIKTPKVTVLLQREVAASQALANDMCNALQTTYLKDVIDASSIWYDPDDSTTSVDDDPLFVDAWRAFSESMGCAEAGSRANASPWLLRLQLDRQKMLQHGLTMFDIFYAIRSGSNGAVKCAFSDDNFSSMVIRVRMTEAPARGRDAMNELRLLEQQLVEELVIKGVPGLRKVIKRLEKFAETFDAELGDFRSYEEFVLDTDGSNLREVLSHPLVDATRTTCNDVQEILSVLGIEAARKAIIREIKATFAGLFMQERHLEVLGDTMTSRGAIMSIDRHGINKGDNGPLARASFEKTQEMLINAAIFSDLDPVQSVSANLMLGQLPPGGTGDTQVLVDISRLLRPGAVFGVAAVAGDSATCTELSLMEFDFGTGSTSFFM